MTRMALRGAAYGFLKAIMPRHYGPERRWWRWGMSKTQILLLVCAVLLMLSGAAHIVGDATDPLGWVTFGVGVVATLLFVVAWIRARRGTA
jgi:hypothetical protein